MTQEEQDKIIALFEKYSFKGQTKTLYDSTPGSGTEEAILIMKEDAVKAVEEISAEGEGIQ